MSLGLLRGNWYITRCPQFCIKLLACLINAISPYILVLLHIPNQLNYWDKVHIEFIEYFTPASPNFLLFQYLNHPSIQYIVCAVMTVTCSVCILLLPETRDTALEDALPPRPNKAFCVCCPSSPPEDMDEPSEPLRKKAVLVPGDIEMTKHMSNNHCTDVWYESFNTYCRTWIYTAQNMIRTPGYTFTSDTTHFQVTWIFPGAPVDIQWDSLNYPG